VTGFIETVKVPGVLACAGLTANQLPPESVDAEAAKGTPVLGRSLVTKTDWAAGRLAPTSSTNDSDCGLLDSNGPLATVRVTDIISGVAVAPVIVTVPEYSPSGSPCGSDDMQTLAGVTPPAGVTANQLLPDVVEAIVEKLAPEGELVSMKQICAGGGEVI